MTDLDLKKKILALERKVNALEIYIQNASQFKIKETKESNDFTDPLYEDAFELALQNESISIFQLQKKLQIGYSRASKLIDALIENGILLDEKGSSQKTVLVTTEDTQELEDRLEDNKNEKLLN